jgi:uncharacterized protein YcbK (DUF882 family)
MTIHYIENVLTMPQSERKEWARRWPNFAPEELCSRDFSLRVDERALDALQDIRSAWGKPMFITSAYRNPAHNKAIGGAKHSQHLITTAFDIAVADSDEGRKLEALAKRHGATGIGRYPASRFIHLDWRDGNASWGGWT